MDVFQVEVQLNRFLVSDVEDNFGLELKRLFLKKSLLGEILKTETVNRNEFSGHLELVMKSIGKKDVKYDCCFSGCRYQARRHRDFVKHLKMTHPRVINVKCNFKKLCLRVFANIEDLINHVRDDHSALPNSAAAKPVDSVNIDVPCKCIMHSCGSMHFQNVKMLMTHINTVHHNDARVCVFENCTRQDIAEEFYKNSKKSQAIRETKLRQSLNEISNLSQEEVDEIVRNVMEDDFFLKAQEQLDTQYKRTKFVRENMTYVAPVEILLNKSEVERGLPRDVIHYIPLQEALRTLLEDKSTIKMFERERKKAPKQPGVLADISDGSMYKRNSFFKENEDALGLLVYSDGVELKVVFTQI
jgi:hypothetical protein